VIEGDEYDTAFFDKRSKFIQYLPHILAINNCEFDHADIFRDLTDVLRTFSHVLRIVPSNGAVVANGDDPNVAQLLNGVTWAPIWRVGVGPENDAVIADFKETPEGASFTLLWRGQFWGKVSWSLPGIFNARNAAMAAVSAGLLIDAKNPTQLSLAPLAEFRGVQRRQQVLVSRPNLTVIEDFGHHPTALRLTLDSLRARYPEHTLVACFEPRSNTAARKVMQDAFQEALLLADEVFLSPPHRGDKLGEARFDSDGVAAALTHAGRQGFAPSSNDELLAKLLERTQSSTRPRCVVFFSNGAFGGIIKKFATSA
jgi:UDP-N-acetylmuramate: L-alanyl-gamma-D-glutamyl-meso-diaminopimelate ligase